MTMYRILVEQLGKHQMLQAAHVFDEVYSKDVTFWHGIEND